MANGWKRLLATMGCIAALALSGCAAKPTQITILATNDIHGGIEPSLLDDGSTEGDLAAFSGVVRAVKAGLKQKHGDQAGVLVLDAGDHVSGDVDQQLQRGPASFPGDEPGRV